MRNIRDQLCPQVLRSGLPRDDLADAVDYAELTERIRAALVEAKCRLIERAAKVVRDVCMTDPRVGAARVSVTKAGSVPHLGSATAILG